MANARTKTDDIDDIEVVATVVRLARGANYDSAASKSEAKRIMQTAQQSHPDIPEARIRKALNNAANRLLAQHA